MGRSKLGLVVAALVTLAGCGNEKLDEAQDALDRWKERGPHSYVYVVQANCYCPGNPVRVVVDGDVVVSAIDTESGQAEQGRTMTRLLEQAVEAADADPDRFDASYDPSLGYLKRLKVRAPENVSDGGYTLTVSCFGEGTGPEVCP